MPKRDLYTISQTNLTGYPPPFDAEMEGSWYRRLAPVAGLAKMGASHATLKPDAYTHPDGAP